MSSSSRVTWKDAALTSVKAASSLQPPDSESLLETLLRNRGVTGEEERGHFLKPDYDNHLHDPFLLPDMELAVQRVLSAIRRGEHIVAYTDYDTDGTPAAVIFSDFFKAIGHTNFQNYIPHRNDEGYGLHRAALKRFSQEGVSLLITADCGISNHQEIKYAQELGIDVIVTDHHEIPETLPPAVAVINPKRTDSAYPFGELCGSGVAFKFLCALIERGKKEGIFSLPDGWEKWLLDMVGIATVSDMVPLVGENRVLAYFGITVLRRTRRPGLLRLYNRLRIPREHLTEDDIGFVIGPRINAASRLDSPQAAFTLLSTRNYAIAEECVTHLNDLNDKRKGFVASIVKEAKRRLRASEPREVVVLGNLNWTPGLLGLAANHLSDEFSRPVFLWGRGGGEVIQGSCRSGGSVHLARLMGHVRHLFLDCGGHEASGGFSMKRDKISVLEDELVNAFANVPRLDPPDSPVIDATLKLSNVNWNTYAVVERLMPFGKGNPKPVFLFEDILIKKISRFGKEKNHAKLFFEQEDGAPVEAISFFAEKDLLNLKEGSRINLTAHIEKSVFRGRPELRLRIISAADK